MHKFYLSVVFCSFSIFSSSLVEVKKRCDSDESPLIFSDFDRPEIFNLVDHQTALRYSDTLYAVDAWLKNSNIDWPIDLKLQRILVILNRIESDEVRKQLGYYVTKKLDEKYSIAYSSSATISSDDMMHQKISDDILSSSSKASSDSSDSKEVSCDPRLAAVQFLGGLSNMFKSKPTS